MRAISGFWMRVAGAAASSSSCGDLRDLAFRHKGVVLPAWESRQVVVGVAAAARTPENGTSGFVGVEAGALRGELFYWFFPPRNKDADAPLVLCWRPTTVLICSIPFNFDLNVFLVVVDSCRSE